MYTDLLKEVEHYLTCIDGLYASDQEDFSEPFRLDCKELLEKVSGEVYYDRDYAEELITNYYKKTDYIIEYGANQRFRVDKNTLVGFKDFYVVFYDENESPFKIINLASIVGIHSC